MKNKKMILLILLLIAYFSSIIFICFFNFSSSGIKFPLSIFGIHFDKFAHAVMFIPYPVLLWVFLSCINFKRYKFILIIVSGILFAWLLEAMQSKLTSYRDGDFNDFVADSVGLLIGIALISIYFLIGKIRRKNI